MHVRCDKRRKMVAAVRTSERRIPPNALRREVAGRASVALRAASETAPGLSHPAARAGDDGGRERRRGCAGGRPSRGVRLHRQPRGANLVFRVCRLWL
jgi:hypothetical protein